MRSLLSFLSALVLVVTVTGSTLSTPASAKRKPPPPPPPPPPATWSTYVKDYGSVINGVKCDLTPETVEATSDGGSIALALSSRPSVNASYDCAGTSWLVKLDSSGTPQWQENVGCLTPPASGGYSYGLALEQTADGGYAIAGGTVDCDSNPICAYLTSRGCGLIEKVDATGRLVWARVYSSSPTETSFEDIMQTSDGGLVAVGSFSDANRNEGGLIVKLDGQGNVQWQRNIGPAGSTYAYFTAVRQAADGGYLVAGELAPPSDCQNGCGQAVLVVKLDANGNVRWQRAFNSFDSGGTPTATEHTLSIATTADGGSVVSGSWGNGIGPGTCCQGPLLLKLDANGNIQWQKAYSGGVYCFFNGYSYQCYAIGGLAYSVHQTTDGGYALSGAGDLKLTDSVPQVPWLAKVDADGNLLWQHFYYQTYPTGRTLSQYFASSDLTNAGGYLGLGFTENPTDFAGELFAVKTDSAGLVGACSQVHPATPLDAVDPGLSAFAPALPVQATTIAQGDLPSRTQPTAISSTSGQC